MNKFKEFVVWLIETPDNRRSDMLTRILCCILVLAGLLLGVTATCIGIVLLVGWIMSYTIIIAILLFVVIPSYLWGEFNKGESK